MYFKKFKNIEMGSSTSSTVGKRKKEDDDHSDGSPLKKNKRHDEGLSKKMQLTYVVFRSRDDLNEKKNERFADAWRMSRRFGTYSRMSCGS